MNLCPTRIGKKSSALMGAPNSRRVTAHRQCRQIIDLAESASGQHNRVGAVSFYGAGIHIAHDNTASFSFYNYQVQQFVTRKKLYATGCYLSHQSLISSQE